MDTATAIGVVAGIVATVAALAYGALELARYIWPESEGDPPSRERTR